MESVGTSSLLDASVACFSNLVLHLLLFNPIILVVLSDLMLPILNSNDTKGIGLLA